MTRLYCVSDNESLQRLPGMGYCMNTSPYWCTNSANIKWNNFIFIDIDIRFELIHWDLHYSRPWSLWQFIDFFPRKTILPTYFFLTVLVLELSQLVKCSSCHHNNIKQRSVSCIFEALSLITSIMDDNLPSQIPIC